MPIKQIRGLGYRGDFLLVNTQVASHTCMGRRPELPLSLFLKFSPPGLGRVAGRKKIRDLNRVSCIGQHYGYGLQLKSYREWNSKFPTFPWWTDSKLRLTPS